MRTKSFLIRPLAVAALFAVCGTSHASFTVFNMAAEFAAATSAPGVDTYNSFSSGNPAPSPITRNAGAYTYTAATTTSTFFGAGTTADPWLSTDKETDSITFFDFSGGAKAIGGNFFGSDAGGNFASGDITIVANDSFGAQSTQTITGATLSSFLGFVSTGTISSLVVTAVQPAIGRLWPTVVNLTIATPTAVAITPVPEPEGYALMLAGLGAVGFMVGRRRG